jgi:hypothetical protein
LNNQPPSVLNIQEGNEDEDTVTEIIDSQVTNDSSVTTVNKPVFKKNCVNWFLVKDLEDVDVNGTMPEIT